MKEKVVVAMSILLSLFVIAASPASAAKNGVYKGKPQYGIAVKLKVKSNHVTFFDADVYTALSGDVAFAFPPVHEKGKTIRIKPNGSFRVRFQGLPGKYSWKEDKRTLTGKFKGNKVTGNMKLEGLIGGQSKYTAKR